MIYWAVRRERLDPIAVRSSKSFYSLSQPIEFPFRIAIPMGGPDPVDPPVQAFENLLPQGSLAAQPFEAQIGMVCGASLIDEIIAEGHRDKN